jgi:hypothetical protein
MTPQLYFHILDIVGRQIVMDGRFKQARNSFIPSILFAEPIISSIEGQRVRIPWKFLEQVARSYDHSAVNSRFEPEPDGTQPWPVPVNSLEIKQVGGTDCVATGLDQGQKESDIRMFVDGFGRDV